jgi:hypothetical protein
MDLGRWGPPQIQIGESNSMIIIIVILVGLVLFVAVDTADNR